MIPTTIGKRTFVWGSRTYVMGIINVTPDSFSGDGLFERPDLIAERARRFEAEGADILDVGGESTRPGHQPVTIKEELRRVIPAIEAVRATVNLPISVDTYRAEVAAAALDAGASMLNDIWGLKRDATLADLAARRRVPIVLMHNQDGTDFKDMVAEVVESLRRSCEQAELAGVPRHHIIADPGIGFGKTWEQNLALLRHLDALKSLGYPVLLGTSRKSFIGRILDLPPDQRVEGTAASIALGIAGGADIVRVHDVAAMVRVARVTDAIVRGGTPVAIGLGSNLGDRKENLKQALNLLAKHIRIEVLSSLYESVPVDYPDQPHFLNAVCLARTDSPPHQVLAWCKEVEHALAREPAPRYGPRTIDLDILLYGDERIDTPDLIIPHPRMNERSFVQVPLAELRHEQTDADGVKLIEGQGWWR